MPKVWTSATVPRATPAAVVAAPIPAREDVRVRQPIPLEPTGATAFAHDHADLDRQIQGLMQQQNALRDAASVCEVQDLLFQRFKAKYIGDQLDPDYLDDVLTPDRIALLSAFRTGNVARVRSTISAGMSWDFVFPPATASAGGVRDMELEGFCRSPLALLVRPDEGNLLRFLPGVSKSERLALIEEALTGGCADPNYPRWYWSSPGAHACFEGDVEALELLHRFGCNLEQKLEWLLQPQPSFTFVHAAAFNGNRNVLEYLKPRVRPSAFQAVDGDGSNALHTLMESSRELRTAELLLELGLDGYGKNGRGRSALSMAIEALPELAARLLAAKARFEYRWWGNDLYWYSFDGVLLPLSAPSVPITFCPMAAGPSRGAPCSQQLTIEQLVVKYNRKELLSAPLLRSLVQRKWRLWGSTIFWRRTAQFVLVFGAALVNSLDLASDDILFLSSSAVLLASWPYFCSVEVAEIRREGTRAHFSSLWNVLDFWHLAGVLALPALHFLPGSAILGTDAGAILGTDAGGPSGAYAVLQAVPGLLQITLALRALQYASLARTLGPLLVTVGGMLEDITRFGGVFTFVLFGFANAFFVLFSLSGQDVEYSRILKEQLLWLLNTVDRELFDGLVGQQHFVGDALFWGYIVLSYFVLLNLLIAVFNSTFEKIQRQAINEWLFLRMVTMLNFEAQTTSRLPLEAYYADLSRSSNSRLVELGLGSEEMSSSSRRRAD